MMAFRAGFLVKTDHLFPRDDWEEINLAPYLGIMHHLIQLRIHLTGTGDIRPVN